jgi:large repetitive protein
MIGEYYMNNLKRTLCSLLSILLLCVPTIAYGQEPGAAGNLAVEGNYVIIGNEATNGDGTAYTGTFNVKKQNFSFNNDLKPTAYQMDVNKPFNSAKNSSKLVKKYFSAQSVPVVGDSKPFWVTDFVNNFDTQITAKLLYSGSKANVWVYNNQITSLDAQKLGKEFDSKIQPLITSSFGGASDVDGNGKVNILCYDIQDGFDGSGGYIGGYFWAGDLYADPHSNQSEIFYIDTYPSMGIGTTKDVTEAYSTLAHEFQHMVNFNRNVLIEGSTESMDTWLDEAMAMAAEQMYTGQALDDRIDYYNYSDSITNGHSLLYWDDYGDVLANYSLSYLFAQYLKIQANQGDSIFKELLNDPNNDYRAVEDAIQKHISPTLSFGKFMTSFRAALLLKQGTGLYGFKAEPGFEAITPKLYTGSGTQLHGGGAVVKQLDSQTEYTAPADKGADVTYTFIPKDLDGDYTPPVIGSINPVSDFDTTVTGMTEADAVVYVMKGTTLLGSVVADSIGNFNVTIPKQKGGTLLQVYAEDLAGNRSKTISVTVKDTIPPANPIVNPVGDNQTAVTGKAEAGTKAVVKSGSTIIGQNLVSSSGAFSVKIAAKKAGTRLTVFVQDGGGNKSGEVAVIVSDKTAPVKPSIYSVGDNQTIIFGRTEAGAKVVIKAGSSVLGQSYANSTGSFLIKIRTAKKAGTRLTVYSSDKAGNQSQTTVTVVDKTAPAIPVVNKVTHLSKSVTGKAEAGSTVYIYNGVTLIGKTLTDKYGKFKAVIKVQKKGKSLEVSVLDKAGNQSKVKVVKVY